MKSFLIKIASFAGMVAIFWWLGGFDIEEIKNAGSRDRRYALRAWSMTLLLYFVGISLLAWAEEIEELFSSDVPPAGYRIIGGLLAIAGGLWMMMLKEV